jgi:site-specific recombinase XerD
MAGFSRRSFRHEQGIALPGRTPNVEEIIAVMRAAGDSPHGRRLRGLIVILWRAGLRIQEALALAAPEPRSATEREFATA